MTKQPEGFAAQLIDRTPKLRAYARSLSRDAAMADDLVQDTLMRAWLNQNKFTQGTSLGAWLNTILRNCFLSQIRRKRYADRYVDQTAVDMVRTPANQEVALACKELGDGIDSLPTHQREALSWVTLEGISYEEAADRSGCSIGTIKSRINRARHQLRTAHLDF
jgi:RNA polymerase sigma-70 factor, ECF subfamily